MAAGPDREDVSPDGQEHRVDFEEASRGIAETRATEETEGEMKRFRLVDTRIFDVLAETEEQARGQLEEALKRDKSPTEKGDRPGIRFVKAEFTSEEVQDG